MLDNIEHKLIKKHTVVNIGSFYYYENFMVSEIEEGVVIDLEMVMQVTDMYTKKYYGRHKPFVYIANRINSYSLNPTVHFETAKILPNTKGYAIVTYSKMNAEIANIERPFLKIPIQIFYSMEEAIKWAEDLIVHD